MVKQGRPPKPEGTKRDNSVHIQGWFDKNHPHEGIVVEEYNRLMDNAKKNGVEVTGKDLVGYAILSLAKESLSDYIEAQKTTETQALARMTGMLSRLERSADIIANAVDALASGSFVASGDIRQAAQDFRNVQDELTEEQSNLMSSIANQYRSGATFDFNDEDE